MEDLLPTLLIVDDEKPTRDGLRRAFDESFDIYVASDYESAVSVLEAEKIDLVLTDLKLGGKTGMDVLEKCQLITPRPICFTLEPGFYPDSRHGTQIGHRRQMTVSD